MSASSNVIELGRWVPCGIHLHALNMTCLDFIFIRRESAGSGDRKHEHYVVCGCRWSESLDRRTRYCKKHPRRIWENR